MATSILDRTTSIAARPKNMSKVMSERTASVDKLLAPIALSYTLNIKKAGTNINILAMPENTAAAISDCRQTSFKGSVQLMLALSFRVFAKFPPLGPMLPSYRAAARYSI